MRLDQHLQRLLSFLSERGLQPPPTEHIKILEIGRASAGSGPLVVRASELLDPADYAQRFEELLDAGFAWLNLSCYGVVDGSLLVAVELPAAPSGAVGGPSVNLSGPAQSVLERDWILDVRFLH